MRAQELMSSPVVTVHVNDSLTLAAKRMWDADIGALPVVNDDGQVTGMLTDRDICMAGWTQGRPLDELLVNVAMAHHAVTVPADATIGAIEELMASHQVRRIPVVDATGKPIGIVSVNDLAIESSQPDTRIKHAAARLTNALAAICRPRHGRPKAA